MANWWRRPLALFLVLVPGLAAADEAITLQGRHFLGTLQQKSFILPQIAKPLALDQLRLVLFPGHPAPLPHCKLSHQFLFADSQRLTGALLDVGPRDVRFRIVTGETLTLPRDKIQGITQADGKLIQWTEDFEDQNGPSSWLGRPLFSNEHVFSGKKSLLVNSASGETTLALSAPQMTKAARRVNLHFFDPGLLEDSAAKIEFVFKTHDSKTLVTLLLNHRHYRRENGISIQANLGWHLMQIDWHDGEVKAYVDDFFLGSQTIPGPVQIASVSFSLAGKGNIWFDALSLSEQAPPLKRTPGPHELDEIWLASGDQIFGKLLQADERNIVLDAPFGKRSYPWSNVRGIFFHSGSKSLPTGQTVEVRFRSGPGVSADQLNGIIAELNDERLLLRHPVLGDFTIVRTRLERLRFP